MIKLFFILMALTLPLKWVFTVDETKCNGCGNCLYGCAEGAISMVGGDAWIDPELCTGCGECVYFCPRDAIYRVWYTGVEESWEPSGSLSLSSNPVAAGSVVILGVKPCTEVIILDGYGRRVTGGLSDPEGTLELDLSRLPAGSYRVVAGEESLVISVI